MPIAMDVYNRIVQCTQAKTNSSGLKQLNEIQIQMEIGHKAALRQRPTVEGFTHDWIVYVRGPEGSNIQHFVEKVEFHLHETFPKARRVVREPPYQVAESGYGGFVLPIDIYLRNNAEPKKIRFVYELFLGVTNTVSHSRCEKIAFQNPSPEFYTRLLRGGAMEDDNSPPSSPAPSGDDGDTSLQTFTTHREQHHQQQQQRTNRPAEKTNNAVRPGKRIPVAVAEDCKVRLNARSIFGLYGKSSAGDERKQPSSNGGADYRRDFEPDIVSHTNYGTPTRPKTDTYYDVHEGPFKTDDGGTPKISCHKRFENGTPKGQNKTVVELEVQFVGQKRGAEQQNRGPVKVSDCRNVENNDDDDVCIVGWTWNTQAKRKLNADNLRAESEQNGTEHRTRKDGERHHESAKDARGAEKTSKNSNFLQKSTSSFAPSSVNPTITIHPQKLNSHNTVTSVANNPSHSKQINPTMSSPKPSTTLLPTASSKTPFNLTTANPSMSKPLPNIPVNTSTFAPKSNVPIYVTSCSVGTKSSVAPSQGKTVPHHHHPATNSFASTTHPRSAIPPQCTMSGDSASLVSRIPTQQSESTAAGWTNESVELPVHEKQRRGRTKKPVLVQPNFEVVKRKRGRPRKEPIAAVEPARKHPASEDNHVRLSAPLNTMVSGPIPVESVPNREKSTLQQQDAPKTSPLNASTTTTTTSSNGATKSLDRIGHASADPVRCVGGQSEKEKKSCEVFEVDDEPVVKEESTHSGLLSDSEVDFQSFSSGIDFRSSLTSTPIKECSVETAEDTKPETQQQKKKSKLRIRFKPFVEKYSYDDDSDVVMSADALANNMNRHTSMNVKWVPMVDRSLMQNEREAADGCRRESVNQSAAEPHVSICMQHPNERLGGARDTAAVSSDARSTQPNRETSTQSTRTESVVAGITISSTRPEVHGTKTSLKQLKSASDVISGSMAALNAKEQSVRPPVYTKSVPITNTRHPTQAQTYGPIENISSCTAGKAVETNQTVKPAGLPEPVSVSTGPRRNCTGDAPNSLLPPSRIPPPLAASDAVPDFSKSQTRSSEGKTKSSTDQDTKSVDNNSEHRKAEEKSSAQPPPRITQSHQRQVPASGSQSSGVETSRTQQAKTIARHKSRPNIAHGDANQNSTTTTTVPRDPVGPLPAAKIVRDESKLRPSVQKELTSGRKRKIDDINADDDKENQPKRAKTLSHETVPTTENKKAANVAAVVDSDKMAPPPSQKTAVPTSGDGKYVVVPNGEHVAALLDLQRKLMSISDMSLLRHVVQIIEETGKYRLNEATFDFDLCNLDPLTVKKLQHCLSAIS